MRRVLQLCAIGQVCAIGAFLYAAETESLVRRVALYEFGSDPAAVRELAAVTLHTAGGNDAAALEKLLIAGLGTAKTLAAKDAFCRDLAMVGGDAAVPKLAAMLLAPDTAEMARYALERIPGARVDAALRDALKRTSPPVQTGIVVSLGRRKDAASLGRSDLCWHRRMRRWPPPRQPRWVTLRQRRHATLCSARDLRPGFRCAARHCGAIEPGGCRRNLSTARCCRTERSRACGGAHRLGPRAIPGTRRERGRAIAACGVEERFGAVAKHGDSPIGAVGRCGAGQGIAERDGAGSRADPLGPGRFRPARCPACAGGSGRKPGRSRAGGGAARARHTGNRGRHSDARARAANAAGDEQTAARTALGAIRGDAADAAILQAIPGAEPKVKVELIRAVGERGITSAAEVLLAGASDTNRPVRIESIRALRETAGPRQVAALLPLLAKTSNENDRREFERTVASAIRRSKEAAVGDVLAAYKSAADPGCGCLCWPSCPRWVIPAPCR